jgi:hypothetical protein
MRKQIVLKLSVIDLGQDLLKEDLCRVEVKDVDHHFGHVQLRLEELPVDLVTLDVGVNSLLPVQIDLLVKYLQQVEGNVVRVAFNGIGKELDVEGDLFIIHELQRKSESSGQDQDFDHLIVKHKLLVSIQEFQNVVVRKLNLRIDLEVVFSFVVDHHRNEVKQTHRGLLVLVYLRAFYANELVALILLDLKHALDLQNVRYHFVVMSLQHVQ